VARALRGASADARRRRSGAEVSEAG